MPADIEKKEDIRSLRIEKALSAAMFRLLERRGFKKITVRDICEESVISRASFYTYFTDKYDFLKWWILNKDDIYEVKEQNVNQFVYEHRAIIKNLFLDADSWTLDVLFDVLHFILHLTTDKTIDEPTNPRYIVLSNFYIGGMIQYLMWQVKNDFPQTVMTMNSYLREVIKMFQEWN